MVMCLLLCRLVGCMFMQAVGLKHTGSLSNVLGATSTIQCVRELLHYPEKKGTEKLNNCCLEQLFVLIKQLLFILEEKVYSWPMNFPSLSIILFSIPLPGP